MIAGFQILLGVGISLAAFLVNAEPACGGCGDGHWGGITSLAAMGVWLAVLGAILVSNVRKYKK